MTHHIGPPPPAADYFGYSCQIWFALEIAGELFGAVGRRAWFSLRFNPLENADSSNPCWLYTELSRAVQQNDAGSRLIEGYRTTLRELVTSQETLGNLSRPQAFGLRLKINSAPVESFRPEVWRLDLREVSRRKYGSEEIDRLKVEFRERAQQQMNSPQVLQPDEYLLDDLLAEEYEIILIG